MKKVCAGTGITIVHKWLPYARAVQSFKTGKYPIHIGHDGGFSEEEKEYIKYIFLLKVDFRFYSYQHKKIAYNDLSELNRYRIGAYIGDVSKSILEEHGVRVEAKMNAETLVKMLQAGRLDYVATEELGFRTYAKGLFPESFSSLYASDRKILTLKGGILFNTKHPDGQRLYELFDEAFKKNEGARVIESIAAKYYEHVNLDVRDYMIY